MMSCFFSTMSPFFISLPTLAITIFLLIRWISTYLLLPKIRPSSLPSPLGLPLIGNLHQLGSLPHRSLRALAMRHGPLILLHFGRVPTLVVSSAEAAEEVMRTHDLTFATRPWSSMADKLLYNSRDISFSPYGEYWRQVRRISVLHLLTTKRVQSFRSVREEEVALMLDKIRASSKGVVNLSEVLIGLTNDIVCRVALGRKYSDEEGGSKRFKELLAEFLVLLGSFPMRDFIPSLGWIDRLSGLDARAEKNAIEVDEFLEKVLEDSIRTGRSLDEGKESSSFVDVLLSLDESDESVGHSLSRESIKAIVLDMFAAGTDTVSTVLEWTMVELTRHPKVLKKAQEEVRRVITPKGTIKEEDINEQIIYMKAVIKEALRLHPPLALLVPRESIQGSRLLGYEIPIGMRIFINAWAIGRDPNSWNRPEEFQPERFLNSSIGFKGQDFQFVPFGAGRRGCPAIPFAIPTIELALANLLYHFNWEMPNGMKGETLDMTEKFGLTIHKKSSLVLVATPCST